MCFSSLSFYLYNLAVWVLVPVSYLSVISGTCKDRPTLKCPYVTLPVTYEIHFSSQCYLNFLCNLRRGQGSVLKVLYAQENTQRVQKRWIEHFIWQINKLLCLHCIILVTLHAISCSFTKQNNNCVSARCNIFYKSKVFWPHFVRDRNMCQLSAAETHLWTQTFKVNKMTTQSL